MWCSLCMDGTCGFGVPYVYVEPVGSVFPMYEWNLWVWCSLCMNGIWVQFSLCVIGIHGVGVPYV